MDRFLIIRRVGRDCQARGKSVRIIHHQQRLYLSLPMPARRCAKTSRKWLPNPSVGGMCSALTTSSAMRIRPHASLATWPIWSAGGRRSWTCCRQPSSRPISRRTTPRCPGSRLSTASRNYVHKQSRSPPNSHAGTCGARSGIEDEGWCVRDTHV
jgi:hypothetical protein